MLGCGDVNIVGVLPPDVQDAAIRAPLDFQLYGLMWSPAHMTSCDSTTDSVCEAAHRTNRSKRDASTIHCNTSARLELTDVQSGLRWTAALHDSPPVHTPSLHVEEAYFHGKHISDSSLAPCVFIATESWRCTRVGESMACASVSTLSPDHSHPAPPVPTTSTVVPFSTSDTIAAASLGTSNSKDIVTASALCTHNYTLSELLGSICVVHAELIRDVIHYLAPARRRVQEVLTYIFQESKRADCYRERYSVGDVQFLLKRLTVASSSRSDMLELKSVGYSWVDVAKLDSTRTRQEVANRAFLSLAQRRSGGRHSTDRSKDAEERSDTEEEECERECVDTSWLRALEQYVDRDILLTVRTGGGGIMAGLGNRSHTQAQQRRHCFGEVSQDGTRDGGVVAADSNKRSRSYSSDTDSQEDETSYTTTGQGLVDGAERIKSSLNSSSNSEGFMEGIGRADGIAGASQQLDDAEMVPRAQPQIRSRRISDMKMCEVAWPEGDLRNASTMELVDDAADLILRAERMVRQLSASAVNGSMHETVIPKPDSRRDKLVGPLVERQTQQQSSQWCTRLVYDAATMHQVSALYGQLLERLTQMSGILTRHAEVVGEARAWCAAYFADRGTPALEHKMRSWSHEQALTRASLLTQYKELHNYVYAFERDITEYAVMHSYGVM